tara:strand:- start:804 stop:2465 length:1662 start_codon:yes stop_codon:yes gene_type:complete
MHDIIIFGGGLSGLTLAHELIKKNFKILIIEKDNELGGMARSDTRRNSFPSEHSWRGYAPFYKNTFQLMKEIPYYDTNVFSNLSIPVDFYLLYDKEYGHKSSLTIKDRIILYYIGINYLLSENRREYYYSYNIQPFLKKYLSAYGYNHIINFVTGPGYGMNKNEISMGHLFHFLTLPLIQKEKYTHSHSANGNNYKHNSTDNWHVMNGPTSDVWINPWIKHLKENGVEFLTNIELVKINYKKNKITSVEIKQNGMIDQLKAKEYILSINPFNTVDILRNSKMRGLYNNFKSLTDNTKSKHISFRIGINKEIKYPVDNIAFVMNDSEFNITWYPQEKHWKQKPSINSLWSGTIIDFEKKGTLFGKNAEHLDNEKLKKEIIYQILRSKSFRKLIYDNNEFYVNKEDIEYIEIWYEWNFNNGIQEQTNKKWVNNIHNEKFRPLQKTEYDNLFLSGAHTKTTINIWSMEGAVESGKITANYILDKYNKPNVEYYKHNDPSYIKLIQYIDNVLYKLYLPNIFNLLIILIIIFILYRYIINANHIKKILRMAKMGRYYA